MNNFLHTVALILLLVGIALTYLDNYYSTLIFYLIGLIYILIGWDQVGGTSPNSKIFMFIGLLITTITFAGEFIVGLITQDTLMIYQETIEAYKNKS
jgi:cytochrome c biogenesis protein CcdA